jgi:predicted SAM-dependent methyltransferase
MREIATQWRICYRHWSAVSKARRFLQDQPLRLNLGCGPNCRPDWLNINLFHSGADLQLDLRKRWPFPDASVAYIYNEHVFEHFEFSEEVPHVL